MPSIFSLIANRTDTSPAAQRPVADASSPSWPLRPQHAATYRLPALADRVARHRAWQPQRMQLTAMARNRAF